MSRFAETVAETWRPSGEIAGKVAADSEEILTSCEHFPKIGPGKKSKFFETPPGMFSPTEAALYVLADKLAEQLVLLRGYMEIA